MEIKDLIKLKREELGLTYEQLGDLVGVGKSTVRKWETGMIENMKCNNIVALSKALGISPTLLMGWDLENNTVKPTNTLNLKEKQLLNDFNKLNDLGKNNVLNYTNDLTHMSKYKVYNEPSHLMPIASHDKDGDFTEEDYKHDDDIMNDPDLWK